MTKISYRSLLFAGVIFLPVTGFAADKPSIDDEIIVTASRVPQARLAVGGAVDVLTEADIKARQETFLSGLLRDLPGIAVNQTGPAGALTQVRLRGAEANHTLVIIDGIEAGDPFNAGEFDFSTLLSGGVSRVEVLRGPQSALWGSEAIGGVINMVTGPTVAADGPWTEGFLEGGSFSTVRGRAEAGTAGGWGTFRGSVAYSEIGGISASPTGPEKDGYDNLTATLFASFKASENLSLSFSGRHVSATTDQDSQDFTFGSSTQGLVIDSDDQQDAERWYGRAAADLSLLDGTWTQRVSAGLTDTSNETFSGGLFSFGSAGRKWDVEYQSDITFQAGESSRHALSALVEYEDLSFENRGAGDGPENQSQTSDQLSAALEYRAGFAGQLFLSAAIRYDDNDRFNNETTYRATAAWAVPDSGFKLRSSFGTGVAQPSFFELFGFNPNFFTGNPDLKPEYSKGWDAGVDYTFADDLGLATLTYFDSNLKDEVFTDFSVFPFTVDNRTGTSTRDGVEISLRLDPTPALSLASSYTYTNAKDDSGSREQRRPRHIGSLNVTYRFMEERATVDLGLNYNGKMQDGEFIFATPETEVTLDDYVLANFATSFDVTDRVQLIGRIENLFDENYEDVFGFATPSIGAYVGVRMRLGQR